MLRLAAPKTPFTLRHLPSSSRRSSWGCGAPQSPLLRRLERILPAAPFGPAALKRLEACLDFFFFFFFNPGFFLCVKILLCEVEFIVRHSQYNNRFGGKLSSRYFW